MIQLETFSRADFWQIHFMDRKWRATGYDWQDIIYLTLNRRSTS